MRTTTPTLVGFERAPWNKGRLIGQKRPLKPKKVWAIRIRLQIEKRRRDLALFNLAIDSKLRGCDLVRLRVAESAKPAIMALAYISLAMRGEAAPEDAVSYPHP